MTDAWFRATKVTLLVLGAIAVCLAAAASPGPPSAFAATFTVNSTADTYDGVCDGTNCTLRESITAANANVGLDTISFNITAGPGTLKTITIASELPDVTDPVILDGTTQPGFTSIPVVRVRASAPIGSDGIVLNGGASGSTVRGLSLTNFVLGDPLWLDGVTGVTVEGNYIGLYDAGAGAVAEVNGSGIVASAGGSHRITSNVVNSYSTCVSLVDSNGNIVRRNILGLSPSGAPLGGCGENGVNPGFGIGIVGTDNIIGGPADDGNLIALANETFVGFEIYGGVGIAVAGSLSARNRIRGNSVLANDRLGIDLGNTNGTFGPLMDGLTANDAMDADAGANGLQNYPTLSTARVYGSSTVLIGALHSVPNQQFAIDFYHAVSGCDPSAHGEGDEYGGSIVVTTDGAGDASFTATMPGSVYFTSWVATATDALGNTSEFSECRFVLAPFVCVDDVDCDTVLDATDNCLDMYNPDQLTSDRNFIDHSPPYMASVDDKTRARSDALGDVCDPDDDNDGLVDGAEFDGCNGSGALSAISADTDADRFLDGVECTLSTDPTSFVSKPAVTACGSTADVDGDKLTERIEVCFYGTDPANGDTDGDKATDGAKDGCEAASLNGDRIVNVADMGMLATAISNPAFRVVSVDVNKDGVWNPADQGLVASFISPAGQCPG